MQMLRVGGTECLCSDDDVRLVSVLLASDAGNLPWLVGNNAVACWQ